jgi:rhamnosyltransferase
MIAILMSAYNGAKYIREQIDSLLGQTYQDFVVHIRVDGSTDGTTEIVDEYARKYPDKIKHVDVGGNNLGCGQSFMWLLEHAEADHYMYCDQDDVWLPTKVEETLAKMKEHDATGHRDVPCVVFTDAEVVDSELNTMFTSLWRSNHRHPEDAKDVYRYAVYRQAALGCTMMFNNETRRQAINVKTFPDKYGQHDRLLVYLCAKLGEVDYLNKPLIKYRQHGANVTSYLAKTQTRKTIVKRTLLSPSERIKNQKIKFARLKLLPFPVSYFKIFVTLCQKWSCPKKWNQD